MPNLTDAFEIDGFVEQRRELEQLLMSNPAMQKKVQGLIRKVLLETRRALSSAAKGEMKSDPRKAYKAVKTAVYRQILGGSVSILSKRRAGTPGNYEPPHKLRPNQRGGNRVERSERTKALQSYMGADRGFVLRFLNAGAYGRVAGTKGGRLGGNRGSIAARNWFGRRSHQEMERAADNLSQYIDALIQQSLNSKSVNP